jgi:hypothetical protein
MNQLKISFKKLKASKNIKDALATYEWRVQQIP